MPRKKGDREEVTQSEAARRLGMTGQALGVWCRRPGAPVVLRKGRPFCLWPDFPRWREAEKESQLREETKPKDSADAERRLEIARAMKAEMEVAELQHRLIPVEEAAQQVEAMLAQLRAQLITLPQRWAPALVGLKSIPELTAKLDDAIHEAMEALSRS